MRPKIKLTMTAAPSSDGVPLAALRLRRSLAWPVGQAEAILSPAVEAPDAGAKVRIEGSATGDQPAPLFTGRILRRQVGLWGSRLLIEEATGPLARLHIDKMANSSTAAKLIQELCQEAGVEAAVEPPGATLPFYAVQFSRSAMDNIVRLAAISGVLVVTTVEGKLRTLTPLPAPVATLQRDGAVLAFQSVDDPDEAAGSLITGDGAMGAKGPGAEGWLLQSLDAVAAGDGAIPHHQPGLKTAADVGRASTTLAMRAKERLRARLLSLAGIPPADLGEAILLTGFGPAPEPARLVGITLTWSVEHGLISRLELNGIGV